MSGFVGDEVTSRLRKHPLRRALPPTPPKLFHGWPANSRRALAWQAWKAKPIPAPNPRP
jgi:hypothetical protein